MYLIRAILVLYINMISFLLGFEAQKSWRNIVFSTQRHAYMLTAMFAG